MRLDHLKDEDVVRHAHAIASHNPKDHAVGHIGCQADQIRHLLLDDGTRAVCLLDAPIVGDPELPDNQAHALLVATRELPDDDVAEIRTRLLIAFGELQRFAA